MATMAQRISDLAVAVRDKFNTITPRILPTGGTADQVLTKKSGMANDVGWVTPDNPMITSIIFGGD